MIKLDVDTEEEGWDILCPAKKEMKMVKKDTFKLLLAILELLLKCFLSLITITFHR